MEKDYDEGKYVSTVNLDPKESDGEDSEDDDDDDQQKVKVDLGVLG